MDGDKRKEMLAISHLIEIGEAQAVPEQIRAMQWIWEGKDELSGVVKRREAEADLFEKGLGITKPAPNIDDRVLALAKQQTFDDELTMESDLKSKDYELDMAEFVMAVEKTFGVKVPEPDVASFKTLRDIATFVKGTK